MTVDDVFSADHILKLAARYFPGVDIAVELPELYAFAHDKLEVNLENGQKGNQTSLYHDVSARVDAAIENGAVLKLDGFGGCYREYVGSGDGDYELEAAGLKPLYDRLYERLFDQPSAGPGYPIDPAQLKYYFINHLCDDIAEVLLDAYVESQQEEEDEDDEE